MFTADERRRFEQTGPGGQLTLRRLQARADAIRSRIIRRAHTEAECADRELSGVELQGLRALGDRSVAFAEKLSADDIADCTLGTDEATAADLAGCILQYGIWPSSVEVAPAGRTR